MRVPTILVTGPVGVGKTTMIDQMGRLPRDGGVPHATVDFDQLTACFPRPPGDDAWGTALGLDNLAAIWRNYSAAGANHLLIARVIESRNELAAFGRAVPGAEIVVVRLRAPVETLQARLRGRDQGESLQWHLDRAVVLAAEMDRVGVEDHLIETDGKDPISLAREVLARFGWLPDQPGSRPSE